MRRGTWYVHLTLQEQPTECLRQYPAHSLVAPSNVLVDRSTRVITAIALFRFRDLHFWSIHDSWL